MLITIRKLENTDSAPSTTISKNALVNMGIRIKRVFQYLRIKKCRALEIFEEKNGAVLHIATTMSHQKKMHEKSVMMMVMLMMVVMMTSLAEQHPGLLSNCLCWECEA